MPQQKAMEGIRCQASRSEPLYPRVAAQKQQTGVDSCTGLGFHELGRMAGES